MSKCKRLQTNTCLTLQTSKISKGRMGITTRPYRNFFKKLRKYYEELYIIKLDNMDELDKFLETKHQIYSRINKQSGGTAIMKWR